MCGPARERRGGERRAGADEKQLQHHVFFDGIHVCVVRRGDKRTVHQPALRILVKECKIVTLLATKAYYHTLLFENFNLNSEVLTDSPAKHRFYVVLDNTTELLSVSGKYLSFSPVLWEEENKI